MIYNVFNNDPDLLSADQRCAEEYFGSNVVIPEEGSCRKKKKVND